LPNNLKQFTLYWRPAKFDLQPDRYERLRAAAIKNSAFQREKQK